MVEPIRVTASEFQKAFSAISDAAQKQPVIITKHGRDHLVLIAAEEYKRLTRHEHQAYTAGELPDEWLEAVRHSEMDSRHNHLNALLEDEV